MLIVDAGVSLITESGPRSISVAAVMRRAGVSRTAFYRQFDGIYDVYAEILVDIGSKLFAETGRWISSPEAVGTPDVVRPNLVGYAGVFVEHRDLLTALHDACGADARLRTLWRDVLIQPFIDTTIAAIIRDQAAGVVSVDVDPSETALALTSLAETASIELLGRQGLEPERYADVITPIWISVLFGVVPGRES